MTASGITTQRQAYNTVNVAGSMLPAVNRGTAITVSQMNFQPISKSRMGSILIG